MIKKRKLVLDLETKNSFQEVGTRDPAALEISVVGVYDYTDDEYRIYDEHQLAQVAELLQEAYVVIGFNIRRFDILVLEKHLPYPAGEVPLLDIMEEIQKNIGHRVSLNSVAGATLNLSKSGDGLEAIRQYRQGRIDELKKYCLDDVRITKEVYEYALRHNRLMYTSRDSREVLTVNLNWIEQDDVSQKMDGILQEAFAKRIPLQVDIRADNGSPYDSYTTTISIDIYYYNAGLVEAFCHQDKQIHKLKLANIVAARPQWGRYELPPEYLARH